MTERARKIPQIAFLAAALAALRIASPLVGQLPTASNVADAEYHSYLAHMAAASSALRLNEVSDARRWLQQAPGNHMQWEWRYLNAQVDSSLACLATGDWSPVRLEYSRCGQWLAVACSDGFARVYRAEGLTLQSEIRVGQQAVYAARFDPHSTRLATCNRDGKIALWSLEDGRLLWEQASGGEGLADVAFHPDGQQLAFCSWYRGDAGVLGLVSVRQAGTGQLVWKSDFGVKPVVSIQYSPDGKKLAAGTWDALVGIWEGDPSNEPRVLHFGDVASYSAIDEIQFSGDGQRLIAASKNGSPRVWNLATDAIERDLPGNSQAVFCVGWIEADRWLLTGGADGVLGLWELATGEPLHRWMGHEQRINSLAVHPDGKSIVTASADHTIRLWSLDQLEMFRSENLPEFVYGMTASRDGNWLVTAGSEPTDLTVWSTDTRTRLRTIAGIPGSINYLDFGAGSQLAGGNWDGDVVIWDAANEGEGRRLEKRDQGGLMQCAFSSDGKWLAASTNKRQCAVWDVESGQLAQLIPMESNCWGVDFSADSQLLAVGDGRGAIHLIDVGAWTVRSRLGGRGTPVNAVKFSPDDRLLAAGFESGEVALYEVASGEERLAVMAHNQRVWTVDFLRDGSRWASGGADRRVRVWDTTTGQTVLTIADFPDVVYNLVFSKTSDDLFVNASRRQLRLRVPLKD